MESLAVAVSVVQFVDFTSRLVSKSVELYRSSDGALPEHVSIETATEQLLRLNDELKSDAITTSDDALKSLYDSCSATANELLTALAKVKVKDQCSKSKSARKALRSMWSKGEIENLEQRLARFRDNLHLHLTADTRQKQTKDEQERYLAKLPNVSEAAFNSMERQHDALCLQRTRVDVLDEIKTWADREGGKCIFWLHGLAGTGKSTIARTVARYCYEKGNLGASFFFSKGTGDAGHARKLFTSIAVQLANSLPSLKHHISEAIMQHAGIAGQSLRDQWLQLLMRPLSKVSNVLSQRSIVMVLDALDECSGANDIQLIVQLLAEIRSLNIRHLRVFVTSRPEIAVRNGVCNLPVADRQDFILHEIPPSSINHDIKVFLNYSFSMIRQEHLLAEDWPGPLAIEALTQQAGGLFIWAATAFRFIMEGRMFAKKRLSRILEGNSSTTAPEEQLNNIYLTILEDSVTSDYNDDEREEWYALSRQILGSLVLLYSPLSITCLTNLLSVPVFEVDQTLQGWHSILNVPTKQDHPIRLHHPSFRDFLLDPKRCVNPNFWVDEQKIHMVLTDRCIQLMSEKLKRDICGLEAPATLVEKIRHSQIEQYLHTEVRYACQYWVQHLSKSGITLEDDDPVHEFLQEHFLHWLEVLCLMQKSSEAIAMVIALESVAVTGLSHRLPSFLYDAKRFILANQPLIRETPLQLYYSALAFAPEKSIIRTLFYKQIPDWTCRQTKTQPQWGPLLQELGGDDVIFSAVAFSFDGKLVAAGENRTNNVKLWDAATGSPAGTLRGHSSAVTALAFFEDKLLASASADSTVRLWHAVTGAALCVLGRHCRPVEIVKFGPAGRFLASASDYDKIVVWDISTRIVVFGITTSAALNVFELNGYRVLDLRFSSDIRLIVATQGNSRFEDVTVHSWDIATHTGLQSRLGVEHATTSRSVVAFSSDTKFIGIARNQVVKISKVDNHAILHELRGHSWDVTAIAFSKNGKLIASGSKSGDIKLWDFKTGAALQTLNGHVPIRDVIFNPDGRTMASTSDLGTLSFWDTTLHSEVHTGDSETDLVQSIVFSLDGKSAASLSRNGTARLWEVVSGALLQTIRGIRDINGVCFSPAGELLASAHLDGKMLLWDIVTGGFVKSLDDCCSGYPGEGRFDVELIDSMAFSPDGRLLASGCTMTVWIWKVMTDDAPRMLEEDDYRFRVITFSPDSKRVAISRRDCIRIRDIATGAVLATLGQAGTSIALCFSPDGKIVASPSDFEPLINLWEAATGQLLESISLGKWPRISRLSFSEDGHYLETNGGLISPQHLSLDRPTQPIPSGKIFVRREWVTQDGENVLWLPPEYRICEATWDNILAVGCRSHQVMFFKIRKNRMAAARPVLTQPSPHIHGDIAERPN